MVLVKDTQLFNFVRPLATGEEHERTRLSGRMRVAIRRLAFVLLKHR